MCGSDLWVEQQSFSFSVFHLFPKKVFLIDISYLYSFVEKFHIFYLFTVFQSTKPLNGMIGLPHLPFVCFLKSMSSKCGPFFITLSFYLTYSSFLSSYLYNLYAFALFVFIITANNLRANII